MKRTGIIIVLIMFIAILAPLAALANWQVYFTGKAQKMFGAYGRGNFSTRSQCEAYRSASAGFERNNSYCSGFDSPSHTSPPKSKPGGGDNDTAHEKEKQQQLQQQKQTAEKDLELAQQREFEEGKKHLLGSLRGIDGDDTLNLKSGNRTASALKSSNPQKAVAGTSWTPEQCRIAQNRVDAYRDAIKQTVQAAERFNRVIAADQRLRTEWEKTMTAASDRARNRGQFLWLALPLGRLERLNGVAADSIKKDGADLADLLAGATDPAKRERIRIARQFVAREKEIVNKLGKSYENINDALTLGGNAPLMLEDPDESPTSPFKGDGMKLREAGDMLFGLIVERDQWKKLAANAPWAKYLAGGLTTAFAAEAAARAMFDSWYDAFDARLAWERLHNMNLNSARYLEAVQKLGVEMRRRSDRLDQAEKEFAAECSKQP
jgi:hypothetical protein